MKKLLSLVIALLVVMGCVFAAGCTGTDDSTSPQTLANYDTATLKQIFEQKIDEMVKYTVDLEKIGYKLQIGGFWENNPDYYRDEYDVSVFLSTYGMDEYEQFTRYGELHHDEDVETYVTVSLDELKEMYDKMRNDCREYYTNKYQVTSTGTDGNPEIDYIASIQLVNKDLEEIKATFPFYYKIWRALLSH